MAGEAVAQLRTVLRLRPDCTFEVALRDQDSGRAAVLTCPGGVVIELDGPGVVDRLAAAAIEAAELLGVRPELPAPVLEPARSVKSASVKSPAESSSVRKAGLARVGSLPRRSTARAEILTATETAAMLGVKRDTLVAWQRTAWGPAPIDAEGVLKFHRSEVLAWLRRSAS